jgi:uncharacterized membrane protein (Fun14 family)
MSIPPEIAWLIPIFVPFIIGLLVGFLIKNVLTLILVIAAIVIVLVVTGALSVSFSDLYAQAMQFLPKLSETGSAWINLLPYASVAFVVGLVIGLWKG